MALTIYRRHSRRCAQYGQPRHARFSRGCAKRCAIWVQGSLGADYVRRSLKLSSWEAATTLIRSWEDAGCIGGARPAPAVMVSAAPPVAAPFTPVLAPPVPASDAPIAGKTIAGMTIGEAIEKFTASLERRRLSADTRRKYANLLENRLVDWCQRHGHPTVAELGVTQMDDFVGTWTDGPLYATKNLERLRAFFRFCVARDWMGKNPATEVKPPQVKPSPTLPFSAEEMAGILAACDRYRGDRKRMRAFVLTMRYSGLRIGDTLALDPTRLCDTNLRLYTSKTGQGVFVPLPALAVAALKQIEQPGRRYFTTGRAKPETARANWSRYLDTIFQMAEIDNGHSHRFRDTFSVALLEKGVSVETVAMLLGNTPAIVQKHYAPWVRSRQVALEIAVRQTWDELAEPTPPSSGRDGEVTASRPVLHVVAPTPDDVQDPAA